MRYKMYDSTGRYWKTVNFTKKEMEEIKGNKSYSRLSFKEAKAKPHKRKSSNPFNLKW